LVKNKLVKGVDEDVWKRFVAVCKLKGVKVGSELDTVLKDHVQKNIGKLLK